MDLCDLKEDIIFKIFDYLSVKEIINIRSNCNTVKNICDNENLWKRLCLRGQKTNKLYYSNKTLYCHSKKTHF